MASINEGDIIEGIFTIALALYIADGKISKDKLNSIRTKIDPALFNNGRVKYTVAKDVKKIAKNRPPDFFTVNLEMRLKAASTSPAFGKEYQVLYERSKDVGKIDKKIEQLIAQATNSRFVQKVDDAITGFLNNNFGELVVFTVVADGIAGESSGGEIKGDVNLIVYATRKGATKKITEITLPFSLKSENVTVSNLSPYKGMLDVAKNLKIKWDAEKKYVRLSKPFYGAEEQKQKFEMIVKMYDELKSLIVQHAKSSNFSKDAFDFLEKNIFGSDLADAIDVTDKNVKEITKQYYDTLRETTKLSVEVKGNNLVFIDAKSKTPIFRIRTKLRPPPANEAKFYLEVGKGLYVK